VLQPLRQLFLPENHPALLVGLSAADDAAVYQINENQAIISTTDFFPPVVDDPYDYGAIAAANALSDIYAMGGQVLFALNIVGFPDDLDRSILREILRGGAEKVAEAGAVIVGGHSVSDHEPKYGLAVTGIIDPRRVTTKGAAQPGNVLLLTKSLGVGVITTALKQGIATAEHVRSATTSMKALNRQAATAAAQAGARAVTDITGFGLLGHAFEMAAQGQVDFHFDAARLPWLPGALDYAAVEAFPGGTGRNHVHFDGHVTFDPAVSPLVQRLLWSPETSGGLLVAVDPAQVGAFLEQCPATRIGEVRPGPGHVHVHA
jgi:selenide,water dikinase